MIMDNKLRIIKLMNEMKCKNQKELSKKLKVSEQQISRLIKTGFHGTAANNVIDFYLNKNLTD